MRLLTRSDFDGLICAVLLKEAGVMDDWSFVHPKDVQDGKLEVSSNDILANVPFAKGCGLWFDHHTSEMERLGADLQFEGSSEDLPSCARVIWNYYGGHKTFPKKFDDMMKYVDKCDSADLSIKDITKPEGWVLLSFIMDPRTGLGRYRDYKISNYQLMMKLVDLCRSQNLKSILSDQDVQERINRYFDQQEKFEQMLKRNSGQYDNLIIIDLREVDEIYSGNRFSIYGLYPEANISLQIIWGLQKQNTVFTVGHSIFNKTSKTDVGSLMLKYGGGGHKAVGTCQVPNIDASKVLEVVTETIRSDG
jgi:nanoRNase/pAp phosphatase (c-di-AMP/oligoRNAs hydrolase)